MQNVLVIGATSAIAEEVAKIYATRGAAIFLVGRDEHKLESICADLTVRGASKCVSHVQDLIELDQHQLILDTALASLGKFDVALIAHGTLPAQKECDASTELALREFSVNATSVISLSNRIAPMLDRGDTLAVISSVAGDRGRASNYLYGSAKAAVTTYLSGLGQKLNREGINVLVVKPGFVDTPMTADFKKGALWAKPGSVAKGIVRSIDVRKPVAYLPRFWWAIMIIIKAIPEFIFRKAPL